MRRVASNARCVSVGTSVCAHITKPPTRVDFVRFAVATVSFCESVGNGSLQEMVRDSGHECGNTSGGVDGVDSGHECGNTSGGVDGVDSRHECGNTSGGVDGVVYVICPSKSVLLVDLCTPICALSVVLSCVHQYVHCQSC